MEGGVRTVLLEAVRATDEALRGLDRAELTADPDGRVELDRVRVEVRHAARMILESVLGMVEAETGRDGHARRVAMMVRSIAEAMGMPRQDVIVLEEAARLHDVGELLLDWESLAEKRELVASERRTMRRHPTIGERLLPTVGLDPEGCRIVGAHHERLDGSGYPDRIAGEKLPLGAQVLAVAETFEAMTNPRPHRPAITSSEAVRRLRGEAIAGRLNKQAVEVLADLSKGPTENGS